MDRLKNMWKLIDYWDTETEPRSEGLVLFPKGYNCFDLAKDIEKYPLGCISPSMQMTTRYKNKIFLFYYDNIKEREDYYRLAGLTFSLMLFPTEFMADRRPLWNLLWFRFSVSENSYGLSILY